MNARNMFFLIGLVCAALLGYAFYMEHVKGLEPCPLCWLQRFAFIAVAAVSLLATVHNPGKMAVRVYGALLAVTAGIGLGLAGRQLWLQSLPADQVPACGPSVEYMLEVLPLFDVLMTAVQGTGDCAAVVWRFLGLSIPGWTALFFAAIVIVGLFMAFRPPVKRKTS